MLDIHIPTALTDFTLAHQPAAIVSQSGSGQGGMQERRGWRIGRTTDNPLKRLFLACGDVLEDVTGIQIGSETGLRDAMRKSRAESIISTFENSTTVIQYDYAENLNDGRGITAGRAGFTSGTSDLLLVVEKYAAMTDKPDNALVAYLPALRSVNGSDSVAGLDGFVETWAMTVASDPALIRAQDAVYDELYFLPALRIAEDLAINSALGQLIILDTAVQHGIGDDPDGLPAIINETKQLHGERVVDEEQWLGAFLAIRRHHLLNPQSSSTASAWADSVSRVDALESLVAAQAFDLDAPLKWSVYGDDFEIPGDELTAPDASQVNID